MVTLKHCRGDPDDRVNVVGVNMKSSGDIAPSMKAKTKWNFAQLAILCSAPNSYCWLLLRSRLL